MIDITMHSDDELSQQVFNDQYFYNEINHPEYLIALIKEEFVYTPKQMETLIGIDIIVAASQRIKQQMDTIDFLRNRLNQCEHLVGELYISQRELEEELYG